MKRAITFYQRRQDYTMDWETFGHRCVVLVCLIILVVYLVGGFK